MAAILQKQGDSTDFSVAAVADTHHHLIVLDTDAKLQLELQRQAINALHFSIRAVLVVNPAQEPVAFDALLRPTSLQYSVSRARRAVVAP